MASIPDGIPRPAESVDIEPERIFADQPGRVRGAEHNGGSPREALALDVRACFEDPFFPANLESIFGCSHNLGHHDCDAAPSDFREGTFTAGIIVKHLGSAGGHVIEGIDPICAHNDGIDRQGSDVLNEPG